MKDTKQQSNPRRREVPVSCAALLLCCSAVFALPSCGPSRTLIHSDAPPKAFDSDVRARWSLGMTRDEVNEAADRIKLLLAPTEDARTLREIDPSYQSGQALVARITRPGINIDAPYFQARRQIGHLYFFFDESARLRNITYLLSPEQVKGQEHEPRQTVRVILPVEGRSP